MTTGRTSFAFSGGGNWDWIQHTDGTKVPIAEILAHGEGIRKKEGAQAERDFLALVKIKLKRAERGELREPEDGRPYLVRQSGVMEIKWAVRRRQWRLYYAEPASLHHARVMLGLLFNHKRSTTQQDADIDKAASRWTTWHQGRTS